MQELSSFDTLPPELNSLIFNHALSGPKTTETFKRIRLVCSKWRVSIDNLFVKDLTISSLKVSPSSSIKVSDYFIIKFHLQGSPPYPTPKTLPKTAEFFKQLGNKLIYTSRNECYVYFLENKVHTKIKINASSRTSLHASSLTSLHLFINIYDLGTDCVVVELLKTRSNKQTLDSKLNEIYRFNPETGEYKKEDINIWRRKAAKELVLESRSVIEKVFADKSSKTTYLLIKGRTDKFLIEQKEETFIPVSIRISLDTEVFGIKNNKVFTKTFNKISILQFNKDLEDVDISPQEYLKTVGVSTDHLTTRAELIYPFVITELSQKNNLPPSLLLIFNSINKNSPVQTLDLSQCKTKWLICDSLIIFIKKLEGDCIEGDCMMSSHYSFFVYRPHSCTSHDRPFKNMWKRDLLKIKTIGNPSTCFIKSTITTRCGLYELSEDYDYLVSPSVLEDAKKIQALLEEKSS